MLDKFKELPITVSLSIGFLGFMWITMMMVNPLGTIGFTAIVFTIASAIRIITFLKEPKCDTHNSE